jgi:hypothetical protein
MKMQEMQEIINLICIIIAEDCDRKKNVDRSSVSLHLETSSSVISNTCDDEHEGICISNPRIFTPKRKWQLDSSSTFFVSNGCRYESVRNE